MSLSKEQQEVIESVLSGEKLITVDSVAGSGKTHTLLESVKALNPKSGIYLAYNKSIADESAVKFPEEIQCSTVHSMAYKNTVIPLGLQVHSLKVKHITEDINEEKIEMKSNTVKSLVISLMEKFFVSEHLSFDLYADTVQGDIPEICFELAKKYIDKMKNREIACSHGFYLKLYQIFLANGHIEPEVVDLIMLDEAGDVNPVILDIFLRYPAKQKIMVGDRSQNIYGFNNTINGFKELEGKGIDLSLTKSYRVSKHIAFKIESFCHTYMESDIVFNGVEYPENERINSIAYIGRTNSALIDKMIEFNDMRIEYNLNRKVSDMFALPLALMNLQPGKKVFRDELKWLEDDAKEYYENRFLRQEFGTLFGYLISEHSHDINLKSAIQLITKHSAKKIYDTYKIAKNHEIGSHKHKVTLTTAHSSKGNEYDEVYILNDFNDKMENLIEETEDRRKEAILSGNNPNEFLSNDEVNEFNLYYVAASRARLNLNNARFIL